MAKYKQARTQEEAEAIPLDQSVQIVLEEAVDAAANTEVEVPDVKPKVKEPEAADTPDIGALRQQIEALTKAEKAAKEIADSERRRADEAVKRRAEVEAQSVKHQEDTVQAQYDAIVNAIEASKADAASAERDLEKAELDMDAKAKAEAYRRLARAEANMTRLEDGKSAFEARQEAAKSAPKPQQAPQDLFEAAIAPMPDNIKTWLRSHPEYMTDQRKNTKMQAVHYDVLDEGHVFGTPAYVEAVEVHLGLKTKAVIDTETEEVAPQKQRTQVVTQAPPTREVPSAATGKPQSTRVVLSPEQREIARLNGLTDAEYAKQVQKLEQLKKSGHYQEGRG